jgi:cbb3-type cytochrome oxidase subunit 1
MAESHTRPDPGAPPGVPRWVKVLGIVFLVLVLVFVVLHLSGNGLGNLHGAFRAVELSV